MKALALCATAAAAIVFATLSYGQTSTSKTPGANPEFPTAGAPANAPTPQEQITKTPGSRARVSDSGRSDQRARSAGATK